MAVRIKTSRQGRIRRHQRLRRKISGTAERPRLAVFRSLKHIYVQIINDTIGHTLVAASDRDAAGGEPVAGSKTSVAEAVGKAIAERALAAGVSQVVFDRGGNRYHGRVKALADGARAGGLQF